MQAVKTIGLDIAKSVFHVHAGGRRQVVDLARQQGPYALARNTALAL